MKRLLLLTLDYPPRRGGVARYLAAMAAYFGERMIVVDRGILFKWIWPHWLKAFVPLFRNRRRFDLLIVSHILPLGLVALIHRRLTGKPYVVILHGMDFALARRNGWKQQLSEKILSEADLVVTNTENLAREVLGFVPPKVLQVVYPTLSEEFMAAAKNFERNQSVGAQSRRPIRLLTVARLVPRKGHAYVLDALARLKSEQRLGAFEYHIVGSGPLVKSLKKHAMDIGLRRQVIFLEQADDQQLIEEYKQADIFVMPTEHMGRDIEGFGMVYIEAAAFALPAIASDLPGVNEAVIDKQTGLLVPSSSIEHLADALERLAADPTLRFNLGLAGRERALKLFVSEAQWPRLSI